MLILILLHSWINQFQIFNNHLNNKFNNNPKIKEWWVNHKWTIWDLWCQIKWTWWVKLSLKSLWWIHLWWIHLWWIHLWWIHLWWVINLCLECKIIKVMYLWWVWCNLKCILILVIINLCLWWEDTQWEECSKEWWVRDYLNSHFKLIINQGKRKRNKRKKNQKKI